MPLDIEKIVGVDLPALPYECDPNKFVLYALGVAVSTDIEDQKFIYEWHPQFSILPTFGVIPPFPALMKLFEVDGVEINIAQIIHGEQYLEIRKHDIDKNAKLTTQPVIARIFDKGKGALMELETTTTDESGDVVYFNRLGVFLIGEGGFGGEKGTPPGNIAPQREPDKVSEIKTLPQQALIYRLSGDPNPLHVDANFAKMVGFDKPILHGLCTFGITGRAVLKEFCDNDPERFKSIKVRFSKHVYPGETIITEMWDEGDGNILFTAKTAERGEPVITNALVEIRT